MKSSLPQARFFKSTGCKVVITLAFASIISGSFIMSASAQDDNGEGSHQDRNSDNGDESRHDRNFSGGGWRHDRYFSEHHGGEQHLGHRRGEWRGDREGYGYRSEYRQPYHYSQPVYVPPPMHYEPRQSPGISLFFPLDLRR
ncbi:MAG: hypothetical protein HYX63_12475 [Gammaproteobacteria bacterium]|nr:hypothetical protein [Gammaproteobacteria bacterium]